MGPFSRPKEVCGTVGEIVTLSRAQPSEASIGITLVRVQRDGAVTIRINATSQTRTAYPGDQYACHLQRRLVLDSSSFHSGTATFLWTSP